MKSSRSSKSNEPAEAGRLALRLYVAGDLPHSREAVASLRSLCGSFGPARASIEIVDVLHEPDRALRDSIFVTPTLVRLSPGPELKLLGALSDRARVRLALGLDEPPPL